MKNNEFHELILSEMKDMKNEIREVRQTDVPKLNTAVAGFRSELETLKRNQTWSTRLYTIVGGALAVAIAKFTGHAH